LSGTDLAPKEINPFPGAAMTISYIANSIDRLGFHYFPDSLHYREQDFQTWLPEMQNLGASWVTLIAPIERAIPEFFIEGLIASKIKPILHFPLFNNQDKETFQSLIRTYARWGVKYVTLFDQPNYRKNWTPSAWVQADLVERFLDDFLPLAEIVYQEEIHPIFPPLVPGGDYWDIAFLRTALRNIKRRSEKSLIDSMIIGTYAYTGNRPLDWGFGGPERWPGARPYFTPSGLQDQLGFRVFDWYFAIAQEELGKALPIILLRAGPRIGDHNDETFPPIDDLTHSKIILEIGAGIGGNLFLFSRIADENASIISIDLPPTVFGIGLPKWRERLVNELKGEGQKIFFIRGISQQPVTVNQVKIILGDNQIDVLFIDGDHSYEGVKRDFNLYSPFVKENGIIAFHDIVPHPLNKNIQVPIFWNEIKKKYEFREIISKKESGGGIGVLFKQWNL